MSGGSSSFPGHRNGGRQTSTGGTLVMSIPVPVPWPPCFVSRVKSGGVNVPPSMLARDLPGRKRISTRRLAALATSFFVGTACGPPSPLLPAVMIPSEMPRSINYNTTQGPQTYVLPTTENACAPEPQRFISIIGEVTYRVKDCIKDEWDYYPESQRIRIQALVNQCRAKCGGR